MWDKSSGKFGFLSCQETTQVYEVMIIYLSGTERGVIESYYLRQFLQVSVKFSNLLVLKQSDR
jgi:hypothetical protein